jgi:uncharacterized membrane protein
MQAEGWSNIGWYNIGALAWFIFLWLGYARFAHNQAKSSNKSLSSVMNRLRKQWMSQLVKRDMRMPDAALIANLERNVTFLASSSILVLAGLLTALASTEKIQEVLIDVPFYMESSSFLLHIKFFVLILIYAYAFFTFSWSMRQYGFASVVIGSAPLKEEVEEDEGCAEDFIRVSAKVIDLAAHTYNYGLRAYYFSLSVLAWFVNVWLFIAASTLVVVVLYLREFHSRPLRELRALKSSQEPKS